MNQFQELLFVSLQLRLSSIGVAWVTHPALGWKKAEHLEQKLTNRERVVNGKQQVVAILCDGSVFLPSAVSSTLIYQ